MTVEDLARAAFGTGARAVALERPHAEARVYRVERGATIGWMKQHRDVGRAAREAAAVNAWGAALGWPQTDAEARGRWVLLPHVPGVPADSLPPDRWPWLFGQIGERLAALHGLRVHQTDPMPLAVAMARRVAAWSERGRGVVDVQVLDALAVAWDAPVAAARVPCHRDVQLHNVLVEGGRVVLIDLGQARPDLATVDVVKLVELPDQLPRGCTDALWDALGELPQRLEAMRLLHGVQTWVWAHEHDDAEALDRGRRIAAAASARWRLG